MKKRGTVQLRTIEKVKKFLDKQKEPVFKSEIIRECGVDANSLNLVLEHLNTEYNNKIKSREVKK